jgi:tRNA U34 5-methylaminomethyl-2-thiouridine-forming methyltransferase MnmC
MHTSVWEKEVQLTPNFTLLKVETDFTSIDFPDKYDVIYFDAFSPEKQPEMWTAAQFEKLYKCSNFEAVLTTYCAKGIVRRAMQEAGFSVERLDGPPGKRHILRGQKI